MKRTIYPEIAEDYSPKAESESTIKDYHKHNKHVKNLLLSIQLLQPLFVLVTSIVLIAYYLHAPPHKYIDWFNRLISKGNTVTSSQIPINGDSSSESETSGSQHTEGGGDEQHLKDNLQIIFAMSLTFSLYALVMSTLSICSEYKRLDYHNDWDSYRHISELSALTKIVLIQDTLVFMCFLFAFFIIVKCSTIWYVMHYSLILPSVNLAIHANYIIIGVIHTPYHATSVAIYYGVVLILNVGCLKVIAYLKNLLFSSCGKGKCSCIKGKCSCIKGKCIKDKCSCIKDKCSCIKIDAYTNTISFFVLLLWCIFLNLLFVYAIIPYFILPINHGFDDAPHQAQAILYSNGIVTIVIVSIAYWIVRKNTKKKKEEN